MIFNLFRKSPATDAAFDAYRSIVAQSRQEKFYAEWGIPDTVTGRFDMISLHLGMLLRRLKGDPVSRPFVQALVDLFFKDMDRSLRELGITDIGVPRRIEQMGKMFYGLTEVLDVALQSGDAAQVEAVLVKNVYGSASAGASTLASYLLDESVRLAAQSTAALTFSSGTAA